MNCGNPCNLVEEKVSDIEMDGEHEEQILLFLDSMDGYLLLLDSLSSTLRQGWLDLASARLSMGSSRVSSALLDLKAHSAVTTVLVNKRFQAVFQPQFVLSKWGCLQEKDSDINDDISGWRTTDDSGSLLRHRGLKHAFEDTLENSSAILESTAVDNELKALSISKSTSTSEFTTVDEKKGRLKSLSVFGALVSPKLRSAQASFETALEIIVEIANLRSSMLSAYSQLHDNINKCSD